MGGGAAAGGDFDAVLVNKQEAGFKGLIHNGRALGLAAFASIGGVLYGYNQGVFGQVQVMTSFTDRYPSVVSDSANSVVSQKPQLTTGCSTAKA